MNWCGAEYAACTCGEPKEHEGEHVCCDEVCGGTWSFDEDGRFVPGAYPGMKGNRDPFDALLDLLDMPFGGLL